MKIKDFNTTLSCIKKDIRFVTIMINKKIILSFVFLTFLNGCVQNTAMLGPVYTFSSSGSVLQTGFSYGSNKLYTKYKDDKNDKELQEVLKKEKKNLMLRNLLEAQILETRKKLKATN